MRKIRSSIYVLVLFATLFSSHVWAQSTVVTGVMLNEVLKGFTTRIQNIVAQAGSEARATALAAAGEVNILVNNISFAYKDALQTTVKETDHLLTGQLQAIDSVLTKLERGTSEDIGNALNQVQQITLTIPFSPKEPQLTKQSPRLTSSTVDQILLKLDGVFYYAKDSGYAPFATVNGRRIEASQTTNRLVFVLPTKDLLTTPSKMILNNVQVTVPYRSNCWLCLSSKKNATFNLLLGVLPDRAGSLEISATSPIPTTEEKSVVTDFLGLSSQDCCNRSADLCGSPMPPGWSYVDNSAQMVELHEIGGSRKYHDWDEKGPSVKNGKVCWYVETYQHSHGTDGNVSFKIAYRIRHTIENDQSSQIAKFDLKWGDSKVVKLPERVSNWVAKYTLFDNSKTYETSSVGKTDPAFVEITRPSSGALQIIVAPPPDF